VASGASTTGSSATGGSVRLGALCGASGSGSGSGSTMIVTVTGTSLFQGGVVGASTGVYVLGGTVAGTITGGLVMRALAPSGLPGIAGSSSLWLPALQAARKHTASAVTRVRGVTGAEYRCCVPRRWSAAA